MSKKQKKDLFTDREILTILNNCVVFTGAPAEGGPIHEARKRRLREYAQAIVAPAIVHVEEELLTPQELVHVLAAAALFVFLQYVCESDKVPGLAQARAIYE